MRTNTYMRTAVSVILFLLLIGFLVRSELRRRATLERLEAVTHEPTSTPSPSRIRAHAGRFERRRPDGTWAPMERAVPPPAPAPELEPPAPSQGRSADERDLSEAGASLPSPFPPKVVNPGFEPDLESMRALTVDLWDNPEFLELDEARARATFPLDDSVPSFPKSIASMVGGLPTEEDLEAGMRSPVVVSALQELTDTRSFLLEMDLRACDLEREGNGRPRSKAWTTTRENLARMAEAQTLELCKRLDSRTAYHDWALLFRLYTAWERSP